MLILSRKVNECIVIDGRITVKVVRVEGDIVKLGIEAPCFIVDPDKGFHDVFGKWCVQQSMRTQPSVTATVI